MAGTGTVMAVGQDKDRLYYDHKTLNSCKYPKFDGLRLQSLLVTAQINDREDVDNLIKYLETCKYCF